LPPEPGVLVGSGRRTGRRVCGRDAIMARGVQAWMSRLIRPAIAAAALTWLAWSTDWARLVRVLREADWELALVGLACFGPAVVLLAVRLKLLLAVQNVRLGLWSVLKATFEGNFVAQALPLGTGGGDTVKAYSIVRQTPYKHEAVVAILFDRLVGVGGLLLMSGTILLFDWNNPAFALYGRGIATAILLLAAVVAIVFSRRLRRLLRFEWLLAVLPLASHLQRMDRAVLAYRKRLGTVAACVGLTVLLQVNAIMVMFLIGWSLGLVGPDPVSALVVYLAYTPICFLTGALPIGVMEVAFAQLFAVAAGLGTREAALSLSFAGRIVQLAWALPGAWFVLTSRPPARTEGSSGQARQHWGVDGTDHGDRAP